MQGFLAGAIVTILISLSSINGLAATPRSIAVTVPAQPVSLNPGETSQVDIQVFNLGTTPVAVTVKGMGIVLGNNGKVRLTGAPDPQWSSRTVFPSGGLAVPARNSIDVAITVKMPTHIAPDFYYIGFLVTPVATGSGIVAINQIGDFVTINVPGPRVRRLSAVLLAPIGGIHLGDVVIGSGVVGSVKVRNIGKSAVQFWGENEVTTWLRGADPTQDRIGLSLLPGGLFRSFGVTAKPAFLIDVVTMTVSVTYLGTTLASTKQVLMSRSFLVINPWVIVAACALVILGLLWWTRSRRRRSLGTAA